MYLTQPEMTTAPVQSIIGCPDFLCHPAEAASTSIIQSMFSYFGHILFDGANDGLKSFIHTLLESGNTSFSLPYFIMVYDRLFALTLLMSWAVALMKTLIMMLSRRHTEGWMQVATTTIRFTVYGIVLPFFVGLAILVSNWLAEVAASIPVVSHHTGWQTTLLTPYPIPGVLAALGLRGAMAVCTAILHVLLNLLRLQLFFVTLFALVAGASNSGSTSGKRLRSFAKGGLITMVFSKPVMIFWVAFAAQVIKIVPSSAEQMATYVFLIEASTIFIPILLFVVSFVVYVQMENRAEVTGEIYTKPEHVSQAQYQADIVDAERARMRAVSQERAASRQHGRAVVKDALIGAGMAKAASKASKLHPAAGTAATLGQMYFRAKKRR